MPVLKHGEIFKGVFLKDKVWTGCMRGLNNPLPAPSADNVHRWFGLGPPSLLLREEAPGKKDKVLCLRWHLKLFICKMKIPPPLIQDHADEPDDHGVGSCFARVLFAVVRKCRVARNQIICWGLRYPGLWRQSLARSAHCRLSWGPTGSPCGAPMLRTRQGNVILAVKRFNVVVYSWCDTAPLYMRVQDVF